MNLAPFIEHTYLKPDCDLKRIEQLCQEAQNNAFYGVCIPPYFVKDAVRLLSDTTVKVVTVVGFPMGYSATPAKVEEVKRAIDEGGDELDVVVNVAAVKSGNWNYVRSDLDSIVRATHLKGKVVKVIFENALLTQEEILELCSICNDLEVNFVKTATGFNAVQTTPQVIAFLKANIAKGIKIKASGGIHDRTTAELLIQAGASRLGASQSLKIIEP